MDLRRRKIGLLEHELDERPFQRVNKRIFITPAGRRFLGNARRIVQDLRNAAPEISEFSRLEWGHLRIGAGAIAEHVGLFTYSRILLRRFSVELIRLFREVQSNSTRMLCFGSAQEVRLSTLSRGKGFSAWEISALPRNSPRNSFTI